MADVAHELNWAGTYGYQAERIVRVTSLDEARDLVTSGARIRPLGTRHSFNDIADGPGALVDPGRQEQADRVVVAQHPDAHPPDRGELSDGVHDGEHAAA